MRAQNRDRFAVGGPARLGNVDFNPPGKILTGQRRFIRRDIRRGAGRNQMASGFPGAGAKIKHVVGAANRFFVVLDHQNRIAEVAQSFKRGEEFAIVARV